MDAGHTQIMPINQPRASFLIAAYNEEKYIGECINSCLEQVDVSVEICVVNDGSIDGTSKILDDLQHDDRIKIHHFDRNRGKVSAFNAAYKMATGDYLLLMGADDVATRDRATASISAIRKHETPLIYGDYYRCNEKLEQIRKITHPDNVTTLQLAFNNKVSGGTICMTRRLGAGIFPIPETLQFEDWWIAFSASLSGKIQRLAQPVLYYRHHDANESTGQGVFRHKTRDFLRHDIYYDELIQQTRKHRNWDTKLARRLRSAQIFKRLYCSPNSAQARRALAKEIVKGGLPEVGFLLFLSLICCIPAGRGSLDITWAIQRKIKSLTQVPDKPMTPNEQNQDTCIRDTLNKSPGQSG